MNSALSQFKWVAKGLWLHEPMAACVHLDEDYGRTFRAYHCKWPYLSEIVRGKNGRVMRFRSAEAAAAYLLKHPKG